ncbi:MAG: hypothetical protein JWR12_2884 [Mucilaginibacter sp.]|nr:hypothetical protein [Mucilaginibacter sp.]
MKFLHTLWTGPPMFAKDNNLIHMKAGWLSCEYHWMSWALSCLQAKDVFGEINLVTDLKGSEILIERLRLPYATVSTALEKTLDHYHPALWALAKIYTYGIQTEPFLHLDGDVFIWHKPEDGFLNNRLIAQNMDKNLPFYADVLTEINANFSYVPSLFLKENYEHKDIYGSNAGLLGGNDNTFFKEYSRQAFEFIDKNSDNLGKVNTSALNFIFEQYLFCQLANKEGIPVSYYKDIVDDPVFKDYIKFEDFPHTQMSHPVGNFKKYRHVCDHVAKKLRKDYPDYYYRIINLVRSTKADMRSAIYYSPLLKLSRVHPFPTEAPSGLSESKQSFERTQTAIKYLNNKHSFGESLIVYHNIAFNYFIDQAKRVLPDGNERDCLLDIFQIEFQRNSLIKKTYSDSANVVKLYNDDLNAFQQIQATFSLSDGDLLKVKISQSENYILVNCGWDWKFDFKKEIIPVVKRNFNKERSSFALLLLPDILQNDIMEYYLDEIDMIIFDMVKNVFTIEEILQEMKNYFAEEEIEEDYPSFQQLIFTTIKRLLYAGSVKIIF